VPFHLGITQYAYSVWAAQVHPDAVEIYLDSAVLIALGLMVPPAEAVVVFAVGQLLSLLALRVPMRNLLINMAMAVLGSTAALTVLGALQGGPGTPREIGAVVAMSATYAAVTLLVTSLGLSCDRRARLRELVTAADMAHAASDVGEVVEVLVRQAGAMLRWPQVELRDLPPSAEEFGAPLTLGGAEKWLVARHRSVSRFRPEDQQALHALVRMAQAVLANRELLEGASYQALHDPLTGLANRALFAETLAGELRRTVRTGQPLAIVYFDLDGFKPVNDELGHEAGDALLVQTAQRLQSGVRASDLVARLGGDEFCVLLPAVNTRADAVRVADSLCQLVEAPYTLPSGVAQVSVSAGVAVGCDDASDATELMRKADQAMYLAKRRGTGGSVSWHETVSSGAVPAVGQGPGR
jgi:diguanylate cyclase (GGDEF)-like protein